MGDQGQGFIVAAFLMLGAAGGAARADYRFTTLATFTDLSNGGPAAGLVMDAQGNLFGTTEGAGVDFRGTVFELPAGSHTPQTLATFDGFNGANPMANLIMDSQGNLLGTTMTTALSPNGGTVFKVNPTTHQLTVLASLGANQIRADLAMDSQGNLFGTTSNGIAAGSVFEVAAGTNQLSTVVQFNAGTGRAPIGGLLADGKGDFFGTASVGPVLGDFGTIFELVGPSHQLQTLAVFDGTGGKSPVGDLVADSKGDLFGVTANGGNHGDGTIFELPAGASTIKTLASFDGTNDGSFPEAGLLIDSKGDLFGTASEDGPGMNGTVFELPAGATAVTTLVAFSGPNGAAPLASLIADSNGDLFGTTGAGGSADQGTVFELTPVPEPGSVALLGMAAGALVSRRPRRT